MSAPLDEAWWAYIEPRLKEQAELPPLRGGFAAGWAAALRWIKESDARTEIHQGRGDE
jgi:hypothetical protein